MEESDWQDEEIFEIPLPTRKQATQENKQRLQHKNVIKNQQRNQYENRYSTINKKANNTRSYMQVAEENLKRTQHESLHKKLDYFESLMQELPKETDNLRLAIAQKTDKLKTPISESR